MTRRGTSGSLAGLFSRLLPSNRPEQGSTLRDDDHNSGESAYLDLGIKPEELTQWNVAEGLSPRRRAELMMQSHVRTGSLRLKKLRGDKSPPEKTDQKIGSLTVTQAQALLDSKEKTRRERRELKASGDFLPVAGYDPLTGDWDALTPTDTLSSDSTRPSVDEKMSALTQNVRDAKKAYNRAKDKESSERERVKLEKAQAKLAKIERRKNELKAHDGAVKWSRHGRHWSSAIEPSLSPIAQSLISSADEMTEEPSFYARSQSFRTPRKGSPLKTQELDANPIGHDTYSEDTTIHKPAGREPNHVTFASPVVTPPDGEFEPIEEHRDSKNPFLWVGRRRSQVLGRLTANRHTIDLSGMEGLEKPRSHSFSGVSDLSHFIDLQIPDCHLDITPREGGGDVDKSPTHSVTFELHPPDTPETMASSEFLDQSSTTSVFLSELSKSLTCTRSTSGATAISSLSKSKEHTKHLFNLPELDLNLSDTESTEEMEIEHLTKKSDAHLGAAENTERMSEDTAVSKTKVSLQTPQAEPDLEEERGTGDHTETHYTMKPEKCVSIPITTTTGCGRSLRLTNQSQHDCLDGQMEEPSAAQQNLSPQRAHDRSCTAHAGMQDQMAAVSPPTTPSRGLQNAEHHLETPKIGTTSSRERTPRKSYLRECSPKIKRRSQSPKMPQKPGLYQSTNGNLQEAAVQAAARTAMWKSRAGAIAGQSSPARAQESNPSLVVPLYKTTLWEQINPSKRTQPQQAQTSASAASADTGARSKFLQHKTDA
ncbi:hypothetical protein KJ359_006022 [Pestalotiopsis sp. 9143b]|nr:hypothetical protein KJ359_006022 [Pestalotiopsis sp. 9143b]